MGVVIGGLGWRVSVIVGVIGVVVVAIGIVVIMLLF